MEHIHPTNERTTSGQFKRLYDVRETYFDVIDTELKAYWLGFLYADGFIRKDRIVLDLQTSDAAHLRKFRDAICPGQKVRCYDCRPNISRVQVSSRRLVEPLQEMGFNSRKSQHPYPHIHKSVPSDLRRHYWRGMIDGDGSIFFGVSGKRKYKSPKIVLYGNMGSCESFREFSLQHVDSKAGVHQKCGRTHYYRLSGRMAIPVIEALYSDCSIALDRKHATAMEIIND